MRHRKAGHQLGMDSSARKAMYRNMVTSLLLHEQIRTTETRAKELRRYVERVITMAKRAPSLDGLTGEALDQARADRVHAMRRARYWVHDREVLQKLFREFPTRFDGRPGGYTRVILTSPRPGDNASMAIVQLVGPLDPVVEDLPSYTDAVDDEAVAAEEPVAGEEAPEEEASGDEGAGAAEGAEEPDPPERPAE